ncbi:reverse transcriptase domain-containing protein [Tanacetum coccineum]
MPNDDERVDSNLNSDNKSQSANSSSSKFGRDANIADCSVNSENNADSSDDIFATQDEGVITLEEKKISKVDSKVKYGLEKGVPNDVIKLMMFPYSLEEATRIWYEKEPPNSILTWDDLVTKFVNQFFPPSKTTHLKNEISRFIQKLEETFSEAWERFKEMLRACPHHGFSELTQIDTFYNGLNDNDQDSLNAATGGNLLSKTTRDALNIIENKSKVLYSRNKSNVSRMNTNSRESSSKTDKRIDKLADQILTLVEIVSKNIVTPAPVKAVEEICVTCSGPHAWYNCPNTNSNQSNVCAATASTSGTLPSNTIPNPKGEMKAITTRSSVAYEGPSIPTNPNPKKVVERETEETTDKEQSNFQESTAQIPPLVNPIPILEPDVLKTLPKPNIPYPLRLNDHKFHEKASNQMDSKLNDHKFREKALNQMEKIFQIFQDLRFNISFADALLLMPRFAPTIKNLLMNKEKLFELAKIPLNENCSAMLLKKLPEKLGDPGKFLIPCNFKGMDVCHTLADLGASINLMPLSIWKKLSLPELTPTRMTLELADRSITHPKGLAEDVFVKVGKFHFPTDFVVVDFEVDPRVPLILGRSFLRTGRALIDVYGEEITLRVNDKAITFNLNQTTRYSSTYDDTSINRIDVIDVAYEDNFTLEEIEAFLNDDSISPDIDDGTYDSDGDVLFLESLLDDPTPDPSTISHPIHLIEKLLNEDLFQLPSMDLKEVTKAKSSIEEPPELELKDLPSHLEYAYLEGTDKLPVIIAKGFKDNEKESLLNVLKSHKRAIAWKITDIKGIDPRFSTHKILMEEDCKPSLQSQRRVNPKIYEVIKKEVIKLFDAEMIYPISDNPWVSLIHYVPKKGRMTVVANEENELIPTRLVTGWRVCIDYRKLNEATRKDHFPLPFMDQIEGIVLGHKISKSGIKVDRAKVDVIAKLPHPTTVKGVRSFLGHAGFYRRFIQNFSKIARPMTHLLEKETPFVFSKDCINAFETLKKKLTEAPILVVPDWNLPFELMCDASDFAIGAVLGQRKTKHFQPIHYAIYTDHLALKYLINKQDAKPRLLRWVLLLQEFDIIIRDKKGSENLAADHLSRLENPHKDVLENKDINENFPLETLGVISSESTPWFADYANFHAGNFIIKGMTTQQKKKFFKDDGENRASWSDKLEDALWAFRTDYKTPIGCTPYKLVYGKSCHLPIELEHKAYWALKHANFNLKTAGDHRKLQLNELNELRDQAYEKSLIYKERTKKLHDSKIKNRIFNIGDRVLLFNSRLKIFSEKLKTRWSGPFTITQVFPYGTIELSQPDGPNFKVNGHHVKHYFGEDIPSKELDGCSGFSSGNNALSFRIRLAEVKVFGTDISQKDEKPSKKRQNRTRDGKVCEDETQSKSRADYANLGNFIYKRKKGEKGNEKKKDVEGLFLYKIQTCP